MFSKREILILLLGVAIISVVFAYYKPFPLFNCEQTLSELKVVNELLQDKNSVYHDFEWVSRSKLAFLLKGIYLSELISFKCTAQSYGLDLLSIDQGHIGFKDGTLFVFLRRSKTLSDFAADAMI